MYVQQLSQGGGQRDCTVAEQVWVHWCCCGGVCMFVKICCATFDSGALVLSDRVCWLRSGVLAVTPE